jgi:hypothetical protein
MPHLAVECGQVEHGQRCAGSGSQASWQRGEHFGVDRSEEALDLAAALRPADGGVDGSDVQRDGGAFKVVAGEVRAVIDVQDVGQSAHHPGRILFAPDRLPQCECCVQG